MSFKVRIQADDFYKAHQVLQENFDTETLAIMTPSVVCLAFSVELYLKEIHFKLTGNAPRSHDIFELFEDLPTTIKQEIFAHKSISQNPFMIRGDIFSPRAYDKTYTPYERFIDQLKAIRHGFEKWRYSYENSTLHYDSSFAIYFIDAVKTTSNKIKYNPAKAKH